MGFGWRRLTLERSLKRLTEITTADAVDKRVAAAGGEDECLRGGVENSEHDNIVVGRSDALGGVQPWLVQTHESYDVIRRPADDERCGHGQHGRRHALHLASSPLRRRPHRRAAERRGRFGQVGRVGDGARGGKKAAQQAPVTDAHNDYGAGETYDELENVPEELVRQSGAERPADLTAVAGGVDIGVEPDREHDDGTDHPRRDARDDGVTRSSVVTRS